MIYVITSIVNGWDNLRPPLATDGARFICFTNNPLQPRVDPWEFRPVYDVGPANMTARVPKILPHLMLPDDAEYSIWHDANFQLAVPPRQIVDETLARHDWAALIHPGRNCLFAEGELCIREGIGDREKLTAELARYEGQVQRGTSGLWANGFIVRRHNERTARLNERWWSLFQQGGGRDQVSFPIARILEGVDVKTLDYPIWSSPFAKFNFHAAWIDRDNNRSYLPERARIREKLTRLADLTGHAMRWPTE